MTTAITFDRIKALVFASIILASAFLSLILAKPAHAATIALNSQSSKATFGNGCFFAHTVSGTDKLLVVTVAVVGNSPQVNSVRYGSQSLTKKGEALHPGYATKAQLWYLVNPTSGTQNVTVSLSRYTYNVCAASSWTGVNQTTPLGTFASTGGYGTSSSLNVSSAAGEVVTDVLSTYFSSTSTPNQTQIYNKSYVPFITNAGSYQTGSATTNMSWNIIPRPGNNGASYAHGAVPIKPAP